MDLGAVAVGGGDVPGQARERAGDVRGAARDVEPGRPGGRPRPGCWPRPGPAGGPAPAGAAGWRRRTTGRRPPVRWRRRCRACVRPGWRTARRRWPGAAATPASPRRSRRRSGSRTGPAAARSPRRTPSSGVPRAHPAGQVRAAGDRTLPRGDRPRRSSPRSPVSTATSAAWTHAVRLFAAGLLDLASLITHEVDFADSDARWNSWTAATPARSSSAREAAGYFGLRPQTTMPKKVSQWWPASSAARPASDQCAWVAASIRPSRRAASSGGPTSFWWAS